MECNSHPLQWRYNQTAVFSLSRLTHICVCKLTIIGLDNNNQTVLLSQAWLSTYGRRQTSIGTDAGILLIGILGTNFSEIWNEIHIIRAKVCRHDNIILKLRFVATTAIRLKLLGKCYIKVLTRTPWTRRSWSFRNKAALAAHEGLSRKYCVYWTIINAWTPSGNPSLVLTLVIWTNAWISLNGPHRDKLRWSLNPNWYFLISENALGNIVWIMTAILSRPQCVN